MTCQVNFLPLRSSQKAYLASSIKNIPSFRKLKRKSSRNCLTKIIRTRPKGLISYYAQAKPEFSAVTRKMPHSYFVSTVKNCPSNIIISFQFISVMQSIFLHYYLQIIILLSCRIVCVRQSLLQSSFCANNHPISVAALLSSDLSTVLQSSSILEPSVLQKSMSYQ